MSRRAFLKMSSLLPSALSNSVHSACPLPGDILGHLVPSSSSVYPLLASVKAAGISSQENRDRHKHNKFPSIFLLFRQWWGGFLPKYCSIRLLNEPLASTMMSSA